MSYTPPDNDNVDFTTSSYTAPSNDSVDFEFGPGFVITIDGEEVTAITIDGEEVTEITIDGDVI